MKALPESIQSKMSQSFSIVTKKGSEKKNVFVGLMVCFFLGLLIYLLSLDTKSIHAYLEGAHVVIVSPVEGTVWELPLAEGAYIRKGEPLLHFDPSYIRAQSATNREQLNFFQQNRHNTGTLKQQFRPLFAHIFDKLALEYKELAKKETDIRVLYQDANTEHVKLKLQLRDPKNKAADGLPNPELVAKEEQAAADILLIEKQLEEASRARADMDAQISKITADLNQPHGMLYRYLEEQNAHVQNLVRNEYLYAPNNGKLGTIFVKQGMLVEKNTPLYEIFPENSGQIWVHAIFSSEDAKSLKEHQICSVVTDDGFEFDARIISIEENRQDNTLIVRLFVQKIPEELAQSLEAERVRVNNQSGVLAMPRYVTVITK